MIAALLSLILGNANAVDANANASRSLLATYAAVQERLNNNQFQRPLYLDSSMTSSRMEGDIHARLSFPFSGVSQALASPANWCDILILHINTKYCRAATSAQGSVLKLAIGKKYDQPPEDAYQMVFNYRVAASTPDYLRIALGTADGPLSSHDYRIILEAVPLQNGQTFIHFSYSYTYGLAGRVAMLAYLGTAGRNKVGFTTVEARTGGQPRYIGGMRGVMERNTMRYYLAIEAFLGAMSSPPQAQFEQRIRSWFAATERYPRQLHEVEQNEYLVMKRKEYRRQQVGTP